MLLCLCLLSMFALPMETAAHAPHIKASITNADYGNKAFADVLRDLDPSKYSTPPPWTDLFDCINWVRVYKNPKTTPTSELGHHIRAFGNIRQWNFPGVETGPSWVMPSLTWEQLEPGWDARGPDEVWVDFVSADDGGALIDTGPNSGLVTATENTTVKPGDRVAIAVKFTTWGGQARPDMAIGPHIDITYSRQQDETVNRLDDNGQPIQIPGQVQGTFYPVPPTRSDIIVPGASVSIFVAHDVSDVGVAAFQTSLTAALAAADPPWTVKKMTYAGGIKIASLGPHGTETRYTVTLSPPLNMKGDIALQIPADAVLDVIGNGHTASETVMVSVDTKTRISSGITKMSGQKPRLVASATIERYPSRLRQRAPPVIRMVR